MKSKRLQNFFISIVFICLLIFGALFENFSQADLVFAASSDGESDQDEATKDMDYILGQGKTLIRIASWYQEYDLVNLKAYLATKFPDYSFEFVYIDKSNYESIMDAQLSYNGAPDIIYMDQEMVEKHAVTRYIADVTDICEGFSDIAKRSFDYGNRVYALPNTAQFECIYYNKDIFEENDIKIAIDSLGLTEKGEKQSELTEDDFKSRTTFKIEGTKLILPGGKEFDKNVDGIDGGEY